MRVHVQGVRGTRLGQNNPHLRLVRFQQVQLCAEAALEGEHALRLAAERHQALPEGGREG